MRDGASYCYAVYGDRRRSSEFDLGKGGDPCHRKGLRGNRSGSDHVRFFRQPTGERGRPQTEDDTSSSTPEEHYEQPTGDGARPQLRGGMGPTLVGAGARYCKNRHVRTTTSRCHPLNGREVPPTRRPTAYRVCDRRRDRRMARLERPSVITVRLSSVGHRCATSHRPSFFSGMLAGLSPTLHRIPSCGGPTDRQSRGTSRGGLS